MDPRITVLHLSDIHRTRDEPVANEELLHALQADFEQYARDGVPTPRAVIVSGDLSQGAEPSEYEQAAEFLTQLAKALGLAREAVVVVPGNHDIHWPTSEEAFVTRRQQPKGIDSDLVIAFNNRFLCARSEDAYQQRLANFRAFFLDFTLAPYPQNRADQFTIHHLPGMPVVVTGFNSCDLNDHERSSGRIHSAAIAAASEQLADFDGYRLAVWHHDLNWRQTQSPDYLGVDSLRQLSQRTFNLGLVGHTHRPAANNACTLEGHALPVVAAGSLCAGPRQRGESVPRSYNIIELRGSEARVFVRVKDERHTPWRPCVRFRDPSGQFVHHYDIPLPRVPEAVATRPDSNGALVAQLTTDSNDPTTPNRPPDGCDSGAFARVRVDPEVCPFQVVGTLAEDSPSYVFRACDHQLANALKTAALTCVTGDFQTGKSSLLVRARGYGGALERSRICLLDLQGLPTFSVEQFHARFFALVARRLAAGKSLVDWISLGELAQQRSLALLLDEFGHLTGDVARQFVPALYHFALTHREQVRVVVSTPLPLAHLLGSWGLNNPKYRHGWCDVEVGPLDDSGIDYLLSLLPEPARALALEHRAVIVQNSDYRVVAVQRLCGLLHEECARKTSFAELHRIIGDDGSYR